MKKEIMKPIDIADTFSYLAEDEILSVKRNTALKPLAFHGFRVQQNHIYGYVVIEKAVYPFVITGIFTSRNFGEVRGNATLFVLLGNKWERISLQLNPNCKFDEIICNFDSIISWEFAATSRNLDSHYGETLFPVWENKDCEKEYVGKTPYCDDANLVCCPTCTKILGNENEYYNYDFCPCCGQKLVWD